MNIFLVIAFLFFIGACVGWILEFLFRNLISHKGPRGKYFINPGFCSGPWLPIYGIGLAAMCVISQLVTETNPNANSVVVILCLSLVMNLIEFIGGYFLLKVLNMRLWDYRDRWGNFMGITCPLFALIWTAIAAVYYLFIHSHALNWLVWLSQHLAFSFVVGLFWGFFIIDYAVSSYWANLIKEYGKKNQVVVLYEELKLAMQKQRKENDLKSRFFNQASSTEGGINGALEEHGDTVALDKQTASHSLRRKHKKNKKK